MIWHRKHLIQPLQHDTILCALLVFFCRLTLRQQAALFSAIMSRSIYLCLSADFRRCKRLQRPGDRLVLYGQTMRVFVIYFVAHRAGVTNMRPHYNLSPDVKIYRRHRCIRSSSASQERLPTCLESVSVPLRY